MKKYTKKRLIALDPEMDARLVEIAKENGFKTYTECIRVILGKFITHMDKRRAK